ncbi:MAG: hypothetical protein LBS75_06910 [Synergistaceae bacterium]|nr:hypothetical protein [Synergistaceae bacterium]
MIISLPAGELKEYIRQQVNLFFPDKYKFEGHDVDSAFSQALERVEYCFKHITLPMYLTHDRQPYFYHMHSDQYSQFLYFLSNSLWELSQNKPICDKLLVLNRALSGFFVSYKCPLPAIFIFIHPLGSVIGNAKFSEFTIIMQGVTVNTSPRFMGSSSPSLGRGLALCAGATIIGDKPIGDRVTIGANAQVHNISIADDSIVVRDSTGQINIKHRGEKPCYAQCYFNVQI